MPARPSVSVIVPFPGTEPQLAELLRVLGRLRLGPDDEVIVADNRPFGSASGELNGGGQLTVRPASGISSPGFARNRAAAVARGEWLVMIDADTEPVGALVEAYFAPVPAAGTALLAGGILDRAAVPGLAARHSADRRQMDQAVTLSRGPWAYAQSANCAVRRDAFLRVGGFNEFARAGEDADLCFRLRAEGWAIEPRPDAVVEHRSRTTVPGLLAQLVRHGSGAGWLQSEYPGSFPPPSVLGMSARLLGSVRRAAIAALRGDRDGALGQLLTFAEACAFEAGRLLDNRARLGKP
jgi:mycofactocin glycosyltransferase